MASNIVWKGSPNVTKGRSGKRPEMIVCHWMAGRLPAADATFAKPGGTSAHYGVSQTVIHQYVSEVDTAYHAGNWDINLRSIGIEHEGSPTIPITDAVYEASAKLIKEIRQRWGDLPLRKHNEFRATQCPGTLDLAKLDRLARQTEDDGMKLPLYVDRRNGKVYFAFDGLPIYIPTPTLLGQFWPGVQPTEVNSIEEIGKPFESYVSDNAALTHSVSSLQKELEGLTKTVEELTTEVTRLRNLPPKIETKIEIKEVPTPLEKIETGRLLGVILERIFKSRG